VTEYSDIDYSFSTSPSPIEVSLGGRKYAFTSHKKCKVCNCDLRFEIDEKLLLGRSYRSILRSLPEDYQEDGSSVITIDNLKNHAKNHLPSDVAVSRAIIEQHAEDVGRAIDSAEGTLVDAYSVANEVMRLGFERIVMGEIKVGLDHTLVAAKMVSDMEDKAGQGVDTAAFGQMVVLLLQHVRNIMSQEQFQLLSSSFKNDPLFASLEAQTAPKEISS